MFNGKDESSMSEFQEACGASGPLLLKIDGEGVEASTFSLPQPFALIGRDERADIPLNHTQVSKRHAYLQVIAGRVFGIDLGSRAGTRWEERNRSSGWLGVGGSIGIGLYRIRLGADDPDAPDGPSDRDPVDLPSPLHSPELGSASLPSVVLEALNAKTRPTWRIDRMLALVGSAPECLVEFPDQGMSRFHCSLLRTRQGMWVIDLLGRDGILVNGQSVRAARLDDGDALSVGKILFRVRYTATSGPGNDLAVPSGIGAITLPGPCMPSFPQLQPPPAAGDTEPPSWLSPLREPGRTLIERPSEPILQLMVQQFDGMQQQMFQMQQQMSDQFHQMMMAVFQMFGTMHQDQMSRVQAELDQIHRVSEELKTLHKRSARGSSSGPDQCSSDLLAKPRSPDGPRDSMTPFGPDSPGNSPSRRASNGSGREPRSSAATDDSLHDLLSQRIAELQRERQSHWHRILNLVVGYS